jgi:hypothetical protein
MSKGKWKTETKEKWKSLKQKKKVDITQCKSCLYRASKRSKNEMGCNCVYIFLMNRRRPCEPSPNCTVFKKYSKKERQELANRRKEVFVSGKEM